MNDNRKGKTDMMQLWSGQLSHPGYKRFLQPNEDSHVSLQGERRQDGQVLSCGLYIVADGMGGHANGQDASRLAIQTVVDLLVPRLAGGEQFTDEGYGALLVAGVQAANTAVHARNCEERADMGTTMTAALVIGLVAYVVNVGDSRTYHFREPDGLRKVTTDHSVVGRLVAEGIIEPDDIYTHPKRNEIYRCLGEKPQLEVDLFRVPLKVGDTLLLCTDGLWEMVRDPAIERALRALHDPAQTSSALIQAALDGGGLDNISVIVVQVTGPAADDGGGTGHPQLSEGGGGKSRGTFPFSWGAVSQLLTSIRNLGWRNSAW
jgi:serine/threonine protein phosphatase PrpC